MSGKFLRIEGLRRVDDLFCGFVTGFLAENQGTDAGDRAEMGIPCEEESVEFGEVLLGP